MDYKYREKSKDYFDLIELPSGGHVPVPQFKEMYPNINLNNIPIGEKVRDNYFYSCMSCGESSYYTGLCYMCSYMYDYDEPFPDYLTKKFAKRSIKKKSDRFQLQFIIQNKEFDLLRYIKAISKYSPSTFVLYLAEKWNKSYIEIEQEILG